MAAVMGIVNVTPDSFSDGGRYFRPEEAVRRARNLVADGADIIDFGAESTRPGATPIGWEEEWERLAPVLEGFAAKSGKASARAVPVSVDTYHPETARRAVAAGARIINCVYADPVPAMLEILQTSPEVELVMPASCRRLADDAALSARIYLDPMIGFGTTREEDLALLRSVPELAREGRVLVGASRKRIVKKLTGEKVTGKNVGGNIGIAIWCVAHGAAVVRVHDVRETVQAIKVLDAIGGEEWRQTPQTEVNG